MPSAKAVGVNSLAKQWEDIIEEYKTTFSKELNEALNIASSEMKQELVKASPIRNVFEQNNDSGSSHFQDSWINIVKYTNAKYIGNTKEVSGHIPLSNLIEFSSKGHPFIGKTFEQHKDKIFNKVVNTLKKGV